MNNLAALLRILANADRLQARMATERADIFDQIASQIAGSNPTAKTMKMVITGLVAVVLLGTVVAIAWIVIGAMKTPDAPASAPGATTSARTPAPVPPKKK